MDKCEFKKANRKKNFKVGDFAFYNKELCQIIKIDDGEYPYLINLGSFVTWTKDLEPYTENKITKQWKKKN